MLGFLQRHGGVPVKEPYVLLYFQLSGQLDVNTAEGQTYASSVHTVSRSTAGYGVVCKLFCACRIRDVIRSCASATTLLISPDRVCPLRDHSPLVISPRGINGRHFENVYAYPRQIDLVIPTDGLRAELGVPDIQAAFTVRR